jgi:hypothetical protein
MPPDVVIANVVDILVGCGTINRIIAIMAEAKTYFAILRTSTDAIIPLKTHNHPILVSS